MIIDKILKAAAPYLKGRTVKDLVIGLALIGIELDNGDIGISYTLRGHLPPGCSIFSFAQDIIGKDAMEVAKLAKHGTDDVQRSVGVAVLIAASCGQDLADITTFKSTFGVEVLPTDTVGMIGFIPSAAKMFSEKTENLIIFDEAVSGFREKMKTVSEFEKEMKDVSEFGKKVKDVSEFEKRMKDVSGFKEEMKTVSEFEKKVNAVSGFKEEMKAVSECEKEMKDIRSMNEQAELLPKCDIVILTGTTVINETIDNILKICSNAKAIIMIGPSTPMFPEAFKNTNIKVLAGSWWGNDDKEDLFKLISIAGGIMQINKFMIKKAVPVE